MGRNLYRIPARFNLEIQMSSEQRGSVQRISRSMCSFRERGGRASQTQARRAGWLRGDFGRVRSIFTIRSDAGDSRRWT